MSWKFWKRDKKSGPSAIGLDFSHVTTREEAERLFNRGELEKVLLLPEPFGGDDIPPNIAYVPLGLADVKATIDGTVTHMAAQGLVSRYKAEPEYRGNSHVPCRIRVTAWDPDRTGRFESTLELW